MRGGLTRGARADDHEVERRLDHVSARYQSAPPSRFTNTSRRPALHEQLTLSPSGAPSTSSFMPVSSAVVSLGAIEFTIFLKSSPAFVRYSLRTTGATLSESCSCLSSSRSTKPRTAIVASLVNRRPTSI